MVTVATLRYHVILSIMPDDRKRKKFKFKKVLNCSIGLRSISSST